MCLFYFWPQMPLFVAGHSMAKEMVQSFWMMWIVLGMRPGLWTVNTLPIITVPIVKMLVLYATEHVSNVNLSGPLWGYVGTYSGVDVIYMGNCIDF